MRNPNARDIPARGLEVPLPDIEESIEMLCHLSGMNPEAHRISATCIVEELQYIEQAASYVRNVTKDFTIYLDDDRHRHPELHGWIPRGLNRQYSHSLATTWLVLFEFVEQEMSTALKFLNLLAFLNPDNIALDFIAEGKNALETGMEAVVADNLKLSESSCIWRGFPW
jgi:hypothetical protein